MWTPFVFFGYEITLPSEMDVATVLPMLYDTNAMIRSPFQIKGILMSFSEEMDEEEKLDEVRIIIGFVPSMPFHSSALREYVSQTAILNGMQVSESPGFFCGIEWCPAESEDDSEYDSEDAEEDASDSDSHE